MGIREMLGRLKRTLAGNWRSGGGLAGVLRRFLLAAVVVAGVGLAGLVFLTRAPPGQSWVVERFVVPAVEGLLDGSVSVEGVSSVDLLRGATFRGVRIRGPDGRPVLVADSVSARYRVWGLATGSFVFDDVEAWGAVVNVERLPGAEEWNVIRLLGLDEEGAPDEDDAEEGGGLVALRGLAFHDARVEVRLPASPSEPDGALVEPAPGGEGRVRLYSFDGVTGVLPEVVIRSPGFEGQRIRIERLGLRGRVVRRPFELERLVGEVRVVGDTVHLDAREIRLPGTRAEGEVRVDFAGDGIDVTARVEVPELDLADLRWLEPRLPDGGGRLDLVVERVGRVTRVEARDADLRSGTSRVRGDALVSVGEGVRSGEMELSLEPLELRILAPFVGDSLPVDGALRGRLALEGGMEALRVDAGLTLEAGGPRAGPTDVEARGILHFGDEPGATDFRLRAERFDWGLVQAFRPDLPLRGPGSVRLDANGRLDTGLRFDAGASLTPRGRPPSRVEARGRIWRRGGDLVLGVRGRLRPLALGTLAEFYPRFEGRETELRGSVQLSGPLTDLDVEGNLETAGGSVEFTTRLDATDVGRPYRVEGTLDDFALHGFFPGIRRSELNGRFTVEGEGLGADSVDATATVALGFSRVGGLAVDSAHFSGRVSRGGVRVDTLFVRTRAGFARGGGSLGLAEGAPSGELHLRVEIDSLGGLRPIFHPDTVVMGDTLSTLEREALEARGVDTDTLPLLEATAMAGTARGDVTISGRLGDFTVEGAIELENASYGPDSVASATLRGRIEGLPEPGGALEGRIEARELRVRGRTFAGIDARGSFRNSRGDLSVAVTRDEAEDYRLEAGVTVDSAGRVLDLRELDLRFDDVRWVLAREASLSWREDGIRVDGFRLERSGGPEGDEPMHIVADGTLPTAGTADFRLEVVNLDLGRVGRMLQIVEDELAGTVSLRVDVTGPAGEPAMEGRLDAEGVVYGGIDFSRVDGRIAYGDRSLSGRIDFVRGDRSVLVADGAFPVNLALGTVEDRIPDRPVALSLQVDSLPAATVLAYFGGTFQEVAGVVGGEVRVGGRPDALVYSGRLRLREGAATLPALGVRHRNVSLELTMGEDRRIRVDGRVEARGEARIEGTVGLDKLSDPSLDLRIRARDFVAVDRRDVSGRVGGSVEVGGSYRRPEVGGSLQVVSGTLRLEEFRRTASVVDLSDPAFFDVVDTAMVADRSILPESENPFLRNLQVDVDLRVAGDTWLRSQDMNVEIIGNLSVVYDRTERNIVLEGRLQAARGSYTAFGRRFDVQEGGVEFIGTPGVNPNLNIRTVHRLRTSEGEPLSIFAIVEGTLRNPSLRLESNAQPAIAQSDLVSYLILGRPGFGLGSGDRGSLGSLAAGALGSTAAGYLTSQLESVVAREFGLDYLTISPSRGGTGGQQSSLGVFGSTQIEVGQYIAPDVFVVVVYQLSALNQSALPGARIEWRFADLWTGELFFEDRFSRQRATGFGELGFRLEKVPGFFIFREWGY